MSWHTDQLKYALGIGGLFSFYGIVAAITYLVPMPSLSYFHRTLILVAFLLITLPFVALFGFIVSRRRKRREQMEQQAAGSAEHEQANPQTVAAVAVAANASVSSGLEELVQFLRSSNLSKSGKEPVYGLPWFIVGGQPRSGKTSLVIGSDLSFQTLPSQRQSEIRFIKPTATVDFRVTTDAVFIDTAGRYFTEGADAEEWSSLIEAIKKYRSNRPLDGLIITVDASRIIKADERELEEMAKVQRARIDDLINRVKIKFPVYLVFTHSDEIDGFRDSFSVSKAEDTTLVWGATFPIDSAENAQALFDGEFEKLSEALMRRRIIRLSAPFPPLRQLRIFNFPLHFNSARRKFGTFVNALFRPSPFSQNPLLRGFYFTAAVPQKASGAQPQTLTASYFIKRLFREVFLRDKDIAAIFIAQRQRPPILGWVLTALGALLVLAALVMSTVSLFSNRQLLAEAVEVGDRVLTIIKADTGKNPLDKKEDETRKEINAIKDMQQLLERLDDYDRNSPPLYLRFGMYSGSRIYKKSLLPIYFSIVEQRFKKPTISALEAELRKFANSPPVANPAQLTQQEEQNLARHYDLLKAYLMLSGEYKDKADSTDIVNALRDFWVTESKVPPDMKLVAQQQLEFWAKQIDRDDDDFKFPRIALDGKLVADTRNKLKDFPAAYRYYSRKVTEISRIVDDKVGKTSVNEILTRNAADTGFLEGSYTVPGAFTRAGFDLMKQAIQEADKKLGEDDWVMGEVGKNTLTKSTDSAMILDRYYRDYADHWRNFVKATHIRKYQNKDDATQALLVLSQANSPLEILMREIAKNTNLSAKPEAEGWIDKILSYIMPAKTTETGGSQPEKEFRPLFTFVGTKEQAENAPIEKYRNELSTLYKALSRVSNDKLKEIASEIAKDDDNTLKIRAREGNINNLLVGFSETPSAQEVANLLQEPIGNLRSLLGVDFKAQTAKVWTQEILPAAKEIEKGYPFDDSQSDADLTKIAAYLNPVDGKFTKFYKDRLERYFEEADGQLRVKKDSEMQFTDEFVKYLNQVRTVQKALFGNSPTPKFEYEFSIRPAKDALIEVTIDGQKTTNEGTGSLKGTFPAAGSAETGVKISLASTAGTVGSANTTGTGSSDSKVFPGNWGLFRFVDSGNPQKQSGGEYLLSYSVGGKTLVATIRPSGGDPFDKRIYRELRAPNAIWK